MRDHRKMESSLTSPSLSGAKSDAQWERWLAKGHAHDAAVRRRVRVVTVSVCSLLALGSAFVLGLS